MPRDLRLDFGGHSYRWFDVDEMMKVHGAGLTSMLTEDIMQYFKLPLEQQILCDGEGPLVTASDLRRLLLGLAPRLWLFDARYIGAGLQVQCESRLLHHPLTEVGSPASGRSEVPPANLGGFATAEASSDSEVLPWAVAWQDQGKFTVQTACPASSASVVEDVPQSVPGSAVPACAPRTHSRTSSLVESACPSQSDPIAVGCAASRLPLSAAQPGGPERIPQLGSLSALSGALRILSPGNRTVEVVLSKVDGQSQVFGFTNVPEVDVDGRLCLRIVDVSRDGLLGQWNAQYPNRSLGPGDHIYSVNGVEGDMAQMRGLLCGSSVRLSARRLGASNRNAVRSPAFVSELPIETRGDASGGHTSQLDGRSAEGGSPVGGRAALDTSPAPPFTLATSHASPLRAAQVETELQLEASRARQVALRGELCSRDQQVRELEDQLSDSQKVVMLDSVVTGEMQDRDQRIRDLEEQLGDWQHRSLATSRSYGDKSLEEVVLSGRSLGGASPGVLSPSVVGNSCVEAASGSDALARLPHPFIRRPQDSPSDLAPEVEELRRLREVLAFAAERKDVEAKRWQHHEEQMTLQVDSQRHEIDELHVWRRRAKLEKLEATQEERESNWRQELQRWQLQEQQELQRWQLQEQQAVSEAVLLHRELEELRVACRLEQQEMEATATCEIRHATSQVRVVKAEADCEVHTFKVECRQLQQESASRGAHMLSEIQELQRSARAANQQQQRQQKAVAAEVEHERWVQQQLRTKQDEQHMAWLVAEQDLEQRESEIQEELFSVTLQKQRGAQQARAAGDGRAVDRAAELEELVRLQSKRRSSDTEELQALRKTCQVQTDELDAQAAEIQALLKASMNQDEGRQFYGQHTAREHDRELAHMSRTHQAELARLAKSEQEQERRVLELSVELELARRPAHAPQASQELRRRVAELSPAGSRQNSPAGSRRNSQQEQNSPANSRQNSPVGSPRPGSPRTRLGGPGSPRAAQNSPRGRAESPRPSTSGLARAASPRAGPPSRSGYGVVEQPTPGAWASAADMLPPVAVAAEAVPAQSDYLASTTDELDLALERCVAALGPGCLGGIPLTKVGKTYKFGSKRVALRLDGREVKVRQGSSWPAFADWLMQEGPTQRAMQEGVLSAPGAATEERPLSARSNETHRETEMVASAQSMWMSSDEEFLT